MAILAGTLN